MHKMCYSDTVESFNCVCLRIHQQQWQYSNSSGSIQLCSVVVSTACTAMCRARAEERKNTVQHGTQMVKTVYKYFYYLIF